jgi:hypothetical protein
MPISIVAILAAYTFGGARSTAEPPARVWFAEGHHLVARIAEARLTPHTAAAVREILAGETMADASVWADLIRGSRRETAPLHFVNIPLAAKAYDSLTQCPGGQCIISAIERDRRALADPSTPIVERTEALKFLIHFVGDLHQPLHVSDNGDRGGNAVEVSFFDRVTNLHKVWDGQLIDQAGLTEDQYLQRLQGKMASLDLSSFERGTVVDWAMEGHRLAVQHAYQLPPRSALTEPYEDANLPVVDLALIKAGVRLAKVLKDALTQYQPGSAAPALGAGRYSDREAAAHVGEEAMVVGTVVSVHRTASGNTYLNFGADYPHQTFSGAILNPTDPALRDLDRLRGKRVGVKGVIKLYKGQAEIVITGMGQIVVEP